MSAQCCIHAGIKHHTLLQQEYQVYTAQRLLLTCGQALQQGTGLAKKTQLSACWNNGLLELQTLLLHRLLLPSLLSTVNEVLQTSWQRARYRRNCVIIWNQIQDITHPQDCKVWPSNDVHEDKVRRSSSTSRTHVSYNSTSQG